LSSSALDVNLDSRGNDPVVTLGPALSTHIALGAGKPDETERQLKLCEENAVRLGGSHAQRQIISATRRSSLCSGSDERADH